MKKRHPLIEKFTIFLFFLFSIFTTQAQDAFRYQAVARDSSGTPLSNQLIGVQIGIILNTESNAPIYVETHVVKSNDYGVFNLDIGLGYIITGDFETIDWSQKSFIKVEIDLDGGSNYTLTSLSELLSVPKALYAESAKRIVGGFGLNVKDFGAIGDGETDDTEAFELALIEAESLGAKLFIPSGIYKISKTLTIGDGVSLIGEGPGSVPLETPNNGSLLRYEGNKYAIKIDGHNAKIRDLVIRDNSDGNAKGGVMVVANNRLVEGVHMFEVLISGFTNGTGLNLVAKNSGGIAYCSFESVRIRHGKIGIKIAPTSDSFVNSNTWSHCQISGGGFVYGMQVKGGNNNILKGMIIEPPSTEKGHLVVQKGEIYGSEIRIEGTTQSPTVPLIKFAKKTKNSTITGVYGGGLTLDKGNNFINMKSGKAIHYRNSSFNNFKNASFFTPDSSSISDWELTGTNVTSSILSPELLPNHNVLKITVPASGSATLQPSPLSRPIIKGLPLYEQVNFGFHVKTTKTNAVFTSTNAPDGWTNSNPHCGGGEWEFVGMNAAVNETNPLFTLKIENTTGAPLDVYITTPTLNFGNQLPTIDDAPIFESGGQLHGLLINAFASAATPSNGFLALPKSANYYEITNSNSIHRINHETANRFPRGSVITLLFNNPGISVTNGGYINLKTGYISAANGSLTLISNGNGTWREVDRNN